jgi:hypothetical protein
MSVQDLINILSSGVFATALTGALAFLGRNWISERIKTAIQHEYNEKLETHKAQLRSQTDTEIVRLKAQLEVAAAERSFRYSHVVEKVADAIAATHKALVDLKNVIVAYTLFLEGQQDDKKRELTNAVEQTRTEFETLFQKNRLYIPRDTAEKIRALVQALSAYQRKYGYLVAAEKSGAKNLAVLEHVGDNVTKLMCDIQNLLTALEDDFQRLLGFPIEAGHRAEQPKGNL